MEYPAGWPDLEPSFQIELLQITTKLKRMTLFDWRIITVAAQYPQAVDIQPQKDGREYREMPHQFWRVVTGVVGERNCLNLVLYPDGGIARIVRLIS